GDLVTMAWWNDTWLNEALGEWSDMNITEAAEPSWRIRDGRIGIAATAMRADETLSTRSIRQPVTTRSGIEASFDAPTTYFRGAWRSPCVAAGSGRRAGPSSPRASGPAHAGGNAPADDFLHDAATHLGPAVADALPGFLDRPGLPRIAAELRCPAGQPPRIELT